MNAPNVSKVAPPLASGAAEQLSRPGTIAPAAEAAAASGVGHGL